MRNTSCRWAASRTGSEVTRRSGYEISAANVFYTQAEQPGLLIQSGAVAKVSAVLLAGGVSYDNLHIAVTPAVPEPAVGLLALLGAGMVLARRGRLRV